MAPPVSSSTHLLNQGLLIGSVGKKIRLGWRSLNKIEAGTGLLQAIRIFIQLSKPKYNGGY